MVIKVTCFQKPLLLVLVLCISEKPSFSTVKIRLKVLMFLTQVQCCECNVVSAMWLVQCGLCNVVSAMWLVQCG